MKRDFPAQILVHDEYFTVCRIRECPDGEGRDYLIVDEDGPSWICARDVTLGKWPDYLIRRDA